MSKGGGLGLGFGSRLIAVEIDVLLESSRSRISDFEAPYWQGNSYCVERCHCCM